MQQWTADVANDAMPRKRSPDLWDLPPLGRTGPPGGDPRAGMPGAEQPRRVPRRWCLVAHFSYGSRG